MNKLQGALGAIIFLGLLMPGCKAKTPSEKVKDKVEDAVHETGQAIERTGKKVKESAR